MIAMLIQGVLIIVPLAVVGGLVVATIEGRSGR